MIITNLLTTKRHKRQEIARWAILAQWPDCGGGYHKGHKELLLDIDSLSFFLNILKYM
jgi:hypothetical protein